MKAQRKEYFLQVTNLPLYNIYTNKLFIFCENSHYISISNDYVYSNRTPL